MIPERICQSCGQPIPYNARKGPNEYAKRKLCDRYCRSRIMAAFLERHYAIRGGPWCAKKLGVSQQRVRDVAWHLGLRAREAMGRNVLLADVAALSGSSYFTAYYAARVAGVLQRRGYARTVPEAWADQWVAEQRERRENHKARMVGYLTQDELPRALGLTRYYVQEGVRGRGPYPELAELRFVRGQKRAHLYNPHEVEALRRRISKRAA